MLTGDSEKVAASVAAQLSIDEYHSELLPADKVEKVELRRNEKRGGTACFVTMLLTVWPMLSRKEKETTEKTK